MTAPEDPGARQEIATTVGQLRRWSATLPVAGEHRERRDPRREVADAIVDALDSRLRGDASISAASVASSLAGREPDLLHTIDELRIVRDTLHRRVTHALAPEIARHVIDQLDEVVDEILREATDLALRELRADAFTDVLTGAGNRRAFERDFHRALENSKRHSRELAVVLLDLDGLKRLNDEHGHAAGDKALRDLATAFLSDLRAGDGFYRIGGDEFALLLPESGADAIEPLVARAATVAPSFSHGWATYPADGELSAVLLERADERLFAGRNERRAVAARTERREISAWLQFAAASVPVVIALVLAELIRRVSGVELGNVLAPSWVGLLALSALLGPPVARRWCVGHRNLAATAACATRVGVVILLVLVVALVPVNRLRKQLDFAALQRSLLQQQQPTAAGPNGGGSRSNGSSGNNAPQLALPPLPAATAPSASTRAIGSVASRATSSPTPAVDLVPEASVTPTPVVLPPLADIGTKRPGSSGSGTGSLEPLEKEPSTHNRLGNWSGRKHHDAEHRARHAGGRGSSGRTSSASRSSEHRNY